MVRNSDERDGGGLDRHRCEDSKLSKYVERFWCATCKHEAQPHGRAISFTPPEVTGESTVDTRELVEKASSRCIHNGASRAEKWNAPLPNGEDAEPALNQILISLGPGNQVSVARNCRLEGSEGREGRDIGNMELSMEWRTFSERVRCGGGVGLPFVAIVRM